MSRLNKEIIKDELRRVDRKIDRKVSRRDFQEHGEIAESSVRRYFDSWNAAKEAAGIEKIDGKRPHTKYDVDASFFEKWDEESAYVYGYILADGSLNLSAKYNGKRTNKYTLRFKTKDRSLLQQIKESLSSEHPIRKINTRRGDNKRVYHELSIARKALVSDLVDYGVEQNKTHTISFPEFLPSDMYRHFIRGFFDGDGSVYRTDKFVCASFTTQSEAFIDSVNQHLKRMLGTDIRAKHQDSYGCHSISYYKKKSIRDIYDYMYPGEIELQRKKQRFEDYLDLKN